MYYIIIQYIMYNIYCNYYCNIYFIIAIILVNTVYLILECVVYFVIDKKNSLDILKNSNYSSISGNHFLKPLIIELPGVC